MNTSTWILALALGVATLGVNSPAAAAKEQISEEARAYFRNGVELLQANPPNYQDAYPQFKLALDKSGSWKALGNLGLCALNLERDGEALRFYEEYLKRGGKEINADERAAIERDMLLVRGNAASVELSLVGVDEVELLDVRSGSSVPGQTYVLGTEKQTLVLRAGTHTLSATTKDGRTLKWEVVLRPGKVASHDFDFNAPPPQAQPPSEQEPLPASATTASDAPAQDSSGGSPLRTVGFITGGVGLALVGAGAVTGLMAKSKEKEVDEACAPTPNNCDPSNQSKLKSASSLATTSTVLFISGGVATLAGVGMVIFGGKSSTQVGGAQVTFVPVVADNGGGLFASGTF